MLLTLVGRVVQFVVMFCTVKVMTTYLPPEEFGRVALITAVSSFFAMFLINPIGTYVNRQLNIWKSERRIRSALISYSRYLLVVALFSFLVVCGVSMLRIEVVESWELIAILVPLTLLIGTANQTLVPSLNLLGLVREFTLLNVLSVLCALCAAIFFVHLGKSTALYWLFGILAGQGLATLAAIKVYWSHPDLGWRPSQSDFHLNIKEVLAFAIPVAFTAGFLWLNFQGYRLLLTKYISIEQLGLFAAGYGLAVQMAAAAELILNTWFQPRFYAKCDSSQIEVSESAWATYAQQITIPMIFIVAGGVIGAPLFVKLMLGPAYQGTIAFYQMGLVVELVRVLVGTSTLFFHQQRLTKLLVVPNATGALLGVSLMAILVSMLGDIMILPALGLGAIATLVWMLVRIERIQPIEHMLVKRFFIALLLGIAMVGVLEPFFRELYLR